MTTLSTWHAPVANRSQSRWILSLVPICGLLLVAVSAQSTAWADGAASADTVLFVCEHGSAKSLLAATLFNREAAARHLKFHAIARGTAPEPAPQPATRNGLLSDGLDVAAFVPQRVTAADIEVAVTVVSFKVDLAPFNPASRPVTHWDDTPPVSANYVRARDAILARIDGLIDQIQSIRTRR